MPRWQHAWISVNPKERDDIAKLWGRNLLRVWADVEKLAAR